MTRRSPTRRSLQARAAIAGVVACALASCAVGEAARSVCPVDLGDARLRVLENIDTITVFDASADDPEAGGFVFDKEGASVVLNRTEDDRVEILAMGRAEEAGGTWLSLGPEGDCRLENGPALRRGAYGGGPATLDMSGVIVTLPAPGQLTIGRLTQAVGTP